VLTPAKKLPAFRLVLAAAAVCWLAWLMFVVHLDTRSMWIDESYSWRISRLGPVTLIQDTAGDVHPPLYYLTLWAWMAWTGSEDLFMMRLTAAIPALLAVAIVIRLGRKWFNNSYWAGAAAGVFLATSGIFINYARELRMYALIVLLICLSWWMLDRLIHEKRQAVLWYGLSLALMAYTFYYAGFVVLIQFIFVALYHRNRLKSTLLAGGLALLLFLPWIPAFVGQLGTAKAQSGEANTPIIGKFLGTRPTSWDAITNFIDIYTAGQPGLVAAMIALAFTLTFGNNLQFRRWLAAIALWFFLVVVLFFAINLVIPIYGLRYVLIVIPALALLVGVGVYRMPTRAARWSLVAIIGVTGILTHVHSFQIDRPPQREILRTISARYMPGDRVWYLPPLGARGSYIETDLKYHMIFDAPNMSTDWFVWEAPREFSDLATTPRVWDARAYWVPILADTKAALETGRTISEQYEYEGYTVHLYEAPPAEGTTETFGDLFQLLPGPLDRTDYHTGDTVVSKAWWRALKPANQDYSYSLILRRADGTIIAQEDHSLQVGGMPSPTGLDVGLGGQIFSTSAWQPDAPYQLATPKITLPADLPPGDYALWIGVYFYQNPERLVVFSGNEQLVDAENQLGKIAAFTVE
jgi:uncharacterized membrane protein